MPGNLDCLNQMLSLSREKIDILVIILFVTKIGECFSAPYGLQKLINVKSLLSVSNVGRNRKQ